MGNGVVGIWTLQSFHMETIDTGEHSEPFGPQPRGTLMLHPDGRMAALITPREAVAATARAMVAYSGRYRLEPPDRLVTTVDVAWHPDWVGTDQVRTYALDGDKLEMRTPPGLMPRTDADAVTVVGLLSWTREIPVLTAEPDVQSN